MFGDSYISEYILEQAKIDAEQKSYKVYITDCLQAIAENTTHYLTGNGMGDYGRSMPKRWLDIIEPPPKIIEEDIDCNEFVADMWNKAKGGNANVT